MDPRLTALKLFLDELEVPTIFDTSADMQRVQTAVYLGQLTGVDLGYRFAWQNDHSFSRDLAEDFFHLLEQLYSEDRDYKRYELQDSVKAKLHRLRPLLHSGLNSSISEYDWLDLVSSLHYLTHVRAYDLEESRRTIVSSKPHLAAFTDEAERSLRENQLLEPA